MIEITDEVDDAHWRALCPLCVKFSDLGPAALDWTSRWARDHAIATGHSPVYLFDTRESA